jgi:hypothetical protein
MFNCDVDRVLRKSLFFLLLMLACRAVALAKASALPLNRAPQEFHELT